MSEEDLFLEWILLKMEVNKGKSVPKINEGDVWWCICGKNVGIEINGKSHLFSRPVLVLKRLGQLGFIGIPLTSQEKTGSWYVAFEFLGKSQTAVISQVRTLSVFRLRTKMGRLSNADFGSVRRAFLKMFQ